MIYEVSKAQASVQEVAKVIIKMITSKMSRSIEETIYGKVALMKKKKTYYILCLITISISSHNSESYRFV